MTNLKAYKNNPYCENVLVIVKLVVIVVKFVYYF
jgi:hypothetical protein